MVILPIMVSEKMDLLFYRRCRPVHDTNFWKMAFFNHLLWKNGAVGFHEIISVC